MKDWAGTDSPLAEVVRQQSADCLRVYKTDPKRVDEDLATEVATAEAGYGRKQIFELVQNGADALLGHPGRIEIVLTSDALYVANEGTPFTAAGIHALMAARLSDKRSEEIGRFGLGFKSVVGITDSPEVFSRSVSFRFDRAWSASQIARMVPGRSHYPTLRLGQPVDPQECAAKDGRLAGLMSWATTVVRLHLRPNIDALDLLREDLAQFPAEFLLFSPHVRELHIADRVAGDDRPILLKSTENGRLELNDNGKVTLWRVLAAEHRPSAAAARDAGELAHRETVTLKWAVPFQGQARLGAFWAFFPTQAKTTLSGIVNAPWKLSDDRRTLIEGAFNEELLTEVLPKLVACDFPHLAQSEDPAAVLDLLPARGREVRSWADDVINTPIFDRLSQSRSLPDLTGVFRVPRELALHPRGVNESLVDQWAEIIPNKESWVQVGVDRTAERRAKAERLILGQGEIATVTKWIEGVCEDPSIEASAGAIALLAKVVTQHPEIAHEARNARILLLEDGRIVPPRPGQVFVRSSDDETGYDFINAELANFSGIRSWLETLGIRVLDRSGELRHALANSKAIQWERVWPMCRAVPLDAAEEIIRESLPKPLTSAIHVRTASGQWRPLHSVFLGGSVVPLDGSRDRDILVDPRYHGADEELITRLGGVYKPVVRVAAPGERWLASYEDLLRDDFIKKATGATPARDKLVIEGPRPPWPLINLELASDEARQVMTEVALQLDSGEPWTVRHTTNASYGKRRYSAPIIWWLKTHGRLPTAFGPWPVTQAIAPDDDLPEDVLPVAEVPEGWAKRLSLPSHPENLTLDSWHRMLAHAGRWTDERRRYRLYSWAVHFIEAPPKLHVGSSQNARAIEPSHVAVSADEGEYNTLIEQRIPVILVEEEEDKKKLIESWNLDDGSRMLHQELVVEPSGEPQLLVDQFPGLRIYIDSGQSGLEIQQCSSLDVVTATPGGQTTKAVPGMLRGNQILVTADQPKSLLMQISHALGLGLDDHDVDRILDLQRQDEARALAAKVRAAGTVPERLAVAVGTEELRQSIPRPALEAVELERRRPLTSTELAEMAIAVHGFGVLQYFRETLERRGLDPPQQWAGRSKARRFAADLGFPTDFAGFAGDRRPAVFEVEGPTNLAPLHDYQEHVTHRLKDVVRGKGPSRGMLALPTGAGKTRVAVQAFVEEIRNGNLGDRVIWIAQSDELCEQAVQTWAYVWRAIGPSAALVISRFWSTNDVVEEPDAFQLVVATPDKLLNVVGNEEYEWLADSGLVIVDEAHSSVAPQYTRVLDWLGRGRSRKHHRPLVGLTATPFRNVNEEETRRLAARYDHHRLDEGAFRGDPYAILQRRGVLARVQQEILQGVDVSLTQEDVRELEKLRRLPSSVESRLGANLERNRRIVESVATLPSNWTVLLFATSVENARTLAAQLSFAGVPAVAISANTDSAARRRYVDQFKSGELRVITNYNVLAQGFDAPAVKAVYVTRPTFSTNLYQQMIGRGLRGPLNGGSEEVLIVNVRDNLEAFGDQLAFYHFDHLWTPESAQTDAT